MVFKDWKILFEHKILQRGHDYYEAGAVTALRVTDRSISATVTGGGSKSFKVKVKKSGANLDSIDCTCPYADDDYCKHMAAVLFAVEGGTPAPAPAAEKSQDEKLVAAAEQGDMKKYAEHARRVVRECADVYGRLKDGHVDDLERDVSNLLDKEVGLLMQKRLYAAAGGLAMSLMDALCDVSDPDGRLWDMAAECGKVLDALVERGGADQQRAFFGWCVKKLDGGLGGRSLALYETVLKFFEQHFNTEELAQDKLDYTDRRAQTGVQSWAVSHLLVMKEVKRPWEDIQAYCRDYWYSPVVRQWYIRECMERDDLGEAVRALEESCGLDAASPAQVVGYRLQLKDLYSRLGDDGHYRETLWELLASAPESGKSALPLYKELKSLYGAGEWLERREEVFARTPDPHSLCDFFVEEKLYDRLLETVLTFDDVASVDDYADILQRDHSAELLQKYAELVDQKASRTTSRREYAALVSVLKHMQKIMGGRPLVDAIVERWRTAYRNRSAMMDELRKIW